MSESIIDKETTVDVACEPAMGYEVINCPASNSKGNTLKSLSLLIVMMVVGAIGDIIFETTK